MVGPHEPAELADVVRRLAVVMQGGRLPVACGLLVRLQYGHVVDVLDA